MRGSKWQRIAVLSRGRLTFTCMVSQRTLGKRFCRYDTFAFLHCDGLISSDVGELVGFSAGPFDPRRGDIGFVSQTEREHQFALREIAGAASQHLPLLSAGVFNADHRANAIAVRACAAKLYAQSVISISTIIAK